MPKCSSSPRKWTKIAWLLSGQLSSPWNSPPKEIFVCLNWGGILCIQASKVNITPRDSRLSTMHASSAEGAIWRTVQESLPSMWKSDFFPKNYSTVTFFASPSLLFIETFAMPCKPEVTQFSQKAKEWWINVCRAMHPQPVHLLRLPSGHS